MSAQTEVPAALTPEEWRDLDAGKLDLYSRWFSDDPAADHAIAATCLYKQSFGFTREDVAKLLDIPDSPDFANGGCYGGINDGPWFASLIARIAALLPPE